MELIKRGGRTVCYVTHKLINSVWNKEELPVQWKGSIILSVYKKGDKIDCGISFCSTTLTENCLQQFSVNVFSICRVNYWGS